MPDVRQNQIDGTGNDDLECGDFLNTKLKRNAEWLEVEGASAVKKKKNGFVDYKGRPQEQVSIEKTKHPETFSYKASQGLSRGQKMLALVKLKRPDISAHNPKMFSKTIARTVKFTTSRQLEKQPSSTSKSVREIDRSLIVKISQEPVGCGTFGQCFLARYRNITAVVKEMKRRNNTFKEGERCKLEVFHEANVLHSLGDHAGLPFLLGICTEQEPYCLVLQFHGCGEESLTLHKGIKRRLLNKTSTVGTFKDICGTLEYIHGKGFLHNDLKSNNVLLEAKKDGFRPIIIDFGKSGPIEKEKGYKRSYGAEYIAPEVKKGHKQSCASDVCSFGKMLETAVRNRSFGSLFSNIISKATAFSPTLRPSVGEIFTQLTNAAHK